MYRLLPAIGNPVRSLDVAEWATGYTRWLAHLGYNPQSAHPWSLDDLQRVLEHLDSRIASATGVPLLRLHRDAFTMTILWETCSRGATAVSWCLDDLWLSSGVSSFPFSLAGCTPRAPVGLALPLVHCQASLRFHRQLIVRPMLPHPFRGPILTKHLFCLQLQGSLPPPTCTPPCKSPWARPSYSKP
jgi:hypothetical protein